MKVSVVYALPAIQTLADLEMAEGATVGDALQICRSMPQFSDLELDSMPVGIYGRVVPADTVLHEGDRMEIYRPLQADPREARRRRSAKRRR